MKGLCIAANYQGRMCLDITRVSGVRGEMERQNKFCKKDEYHNIFEWNFDIIVSLQMTSNPVTSVGYSHSVTATPLCFSSTTPTLGHLRLFWLTQLTEY